MNNRVKFFLRLIFALPVSISYACYPGLDCPEDLPGNTKKIGTIDEWEMADRYLLKDGLVKDPITGLMWMRCSFGQTWNGSVCQGKAAEVTWAQAKKISKNFTYAGYNDWRVPTLEELKSLVYCSSGQPELYNTAMGECLEDYSPPTIVQTAFSETPSVRFWSSSPHSDNNYDAWLVNFNYGSSGLDHKSNAYAVRLVRSE